MYAKVLLCLAIPVVANAMGVIDVARKTCQGPDGASAATTVTPRFEAASREECIANCQSHSAAYPDECRRTIVWGPDCGDDPAVWGPGICDHVGGTSNCWCNYQTTCGCECYLCPVPDWMFDIDPQGGTYPQPDWDAIPPCPAHAGGPPAATC